MPYRVHVNQNCCLYCLRGAATHASSQVLVYCFVWCKYAEGKHWIPTRFLAAGRVCFGGGLFTLGISMVMVLIFSSCTLTTSWKIRDSMASRASDTASEVPALAQAQSPACCQSHINTSCTPLSLYHLLRLLAIQIRTRTHHQHSFHRSRAAALGEMQR